MNKYNIAEEKEIDSLLTTDIYFKRTVEILKKNNVDKKVYAEFTSSQSRYPFGVFTGLEFVVKMLEGKPVTLYALREGTVFPFYSEDGIRVPVMAIEGNYIDFSQHETPILGFICHASGVSTKAFLIKNAAEDRVVLSFGIRRVHPALAPFIDRNAYIGGCDGVSSILGARAIGKEPQGTMPHALMLVMGEERAWEAYDRVLSPDVKRIILVDTFSDEKDASLRAARLLRDRLYGVRLDTPGSRRGNMEQIVREVRWELDMKGYSHVKIFVSGGLDVDEVKRLAKAGVDGFGVGTSIANARVIDFAMDIVEVDGIPLSKKGKFSGRKQVYRCKNCGRFYVRRYNETYEKCDACGGEVEPLMIKFLDRGKRTVELDSVDSIKEYVESQRKYWKEKVM